jgi:hypothetical protein
VSQVLTLRMSRAVPLLSLYVFMAGTRRNFHDFNNSIMCSRIVPARSS